MAAPEADWWHLLSAESFATITLINRFRPDGLDATATPPDEADQLVTRIERLSDSVTAALEQFDFRAATDSLWRVVTEANRFVSVARPWELGKAERSGNAAEPERLDAVLVVLVRACGAIADQLQLFLPGAATRIAHAVESGDPELGRALFAKAELVP